MEQTAEQVTAMHAALLILTNDGELADWSGASSPSVRWTLRTRHCRYGLARGALHTGGLSPHARPDHPTGSPARCATMGSERR